MAIDPIRVLERLMDRNIDTDSEELKTAIKQEAENNPALREAIAEQVRTQLAKKLKAGEILTAEEQALWDSLG